MSISTYKVALVARRISDRHMLRWIKQFCVVDYVFDRATLAVANTGLVAVPLGKRFLVYTEVFRDRPFLAG